jgi:hypothetical protein
MKWFWGSTFLPIVNDRSRFATIVECVQTLECCLWSDGIPQTWSTWAFCIFWNMTHLQRPVFKLILFFSVILFHAILYFVTLTHTHNYAHIFKDYLFFCFFFFCLWRYKNFQIKYGGKFFFFSFALFQLLLLLSATPYTHTYIHIHIYIYIYIFDSSSNNTFSSSSFFYAPCWFPKSSHRSSGHTCSSSWCLLPLQ